MTKTRLNLHPSRGGHRFVVGAPVAFVLGLLLAACQSAPPPDIHAVGQGADVLMRVADDTRNGGDLGTAVDLYRRAHQLQPNDPRPLARLGATLLQLHAYTEAARAYRSAIAAAPEDGDLHRGLATVLLALNQPAGALDELKLAVAKNDHDARLYNAMGIAHDLMGRHDLAQQDYRDGLRIAPKNSGLKNNYGLSLALSGDYPAAAGTLKDIADELDAPARYRLNLALVYGLAGDDRQAASVARTALDERAVRSNLAYYALLRGMDDKARANAIMGGGVPTAAALKDPPPKAAQTAPGKERVASAPAEPVAQAVLPAPPPRPAPAPAAGNSPAPAEVSSAAPTTPVKLAAAETVQSAAASPAPSAKPAEPAPAAAAAQRPAEAHDAAATPNTPSPAAVPATVAAAAPDAPAASSAAPATHVAEMAPIPDPAQAAKAPVSEASTGGFVVQLGSFSSEGNAHKLADELNSKGYDVAVFHDHDRSGRGWYVVRAGDYADAKAAAAAARHMRESAQVPAVVVHLRGPSQA